MFRPSVGTIPTHIWKWLSTCILDAAMLHYFIISTKYKYADRKLYSVYVHTLQPCGPLLLCIHTAYLQLVKTKIARHDSISVTMYLITVI